MKCGQDGSYNSTLTATSSLDVSFARGHIADNLQTTSIAASGSTLDGSIHDGTCINAS